MKQCINILEKLIDLFSNLVYFLIIGLVILVSVDVTLRYVFDIATFATNELEWQTFSFIILLGMAVTLKEQAHVRVDVFYNKWSPKTQVMVDIILTILFLLPFCGIYMYYGYAYAHESFLVNEGSPNPGGLPAWWIVKFSIPIGFTLLAIQALIELVRLVQEFRALQRHKPVEHPHHHELVEL